MKKGWIGVLLVVPFTCNAENQSVAEPLPLAETAVTVAAPEKAPVSQKTAVLEKTPVLQKSTVVPEFSRPATDERPTLVEKLKDQKPSANRGVATSYSSVFMGLVATLGILLGLAWVTKRIRAKVPGMASDMKMLEMMSLGPREKVCVVKINDKKLLLGVTQHNISVLHTFDDEKKKDDSDGMFSEKIKKMLQNGTSNGR